MIDKKYLTEVYDKLILEQREYYIKWRDRGSANETIEDRKNYTIYFFLKNITDNIMQLGLLKD